MLDELVVQAIDEDADAVEPKALALLVEVEVRVAHVRVGHGVERALVRLLDRLLVPVRVDEVDEVLRAIERDLLREVARERLGLCREGKRGRG